MPSPEIFDNNVPVSWCPGCGNHLILSAFKEVLAGLDLNPHQLLLVSGIGQAAKFPHYMRCNALNGLHGRALPLATAAKLVNHKLVVVVVSGDGDCYAEGGNHFVHAIRRNPDITLLVHNNQVYGLTRGQASPTCELGFVTRVQTHGVMYPPLNPLALAVSQGASFVARGYAGNGEHLKRLIKEALLNPGFSLLDILQPCVSFDHRHSYQWYEKRVYPLDKKYNPYDKAGASKKVDEWGEKIPLGILYKKERPVFEHQQPVLHDKTLIEQTPDPAIVNSLADEFL